MAAERFQWCSNMFIVDLARNLVFLQQHRVEKSRLWVWTWGFPALNLFQLSFDDYVNIEYYECLAKLPSQYDYDSLIGFSQRSRWIACGGSKCKTWELLEWQVLGHRGRAKTFSLWDLETAVGNGWKRLWPMTWKALDSLDSLDSR